MKLETVLITGAAGFIGSHVAELLLQQGYNVIGIDNFDPFYDRSIKEKNIQILSSHDNFTFHEIDIKIPHNLNSIVEEVQAVIHLAAKAGVLPSIKNPQEYLDTNVTGTLNVLNWIREREIKKLVFASSSSIYGNHPSIPYKEDLSVDHPISPYAFSKKSCELLNYTFSYLYKIDIINLRLFTVYGPRQRPDLAIHKFFNLIEEGKEIPVYGDGSTARDYTYVEDTAKGILLALDYLKNHNQVYEIINLGNRTPIKLLDLINAIGESLNTKPKLKFLSMQPGDVDITYANINKAIHLLNYSPSTSLKNGLEKFNFWFQNQKTLS